jgi:hypothetical protein
MIQKLLTAHLWRWAMLCVSSRTRFALDIEPPTDNASLLQAYAARQLNSPLESGQIKDIKDCMRPVTGVFSEDRVRNITEEVSHLLK